MSELTPTRELHDVPGMWGRLLPLKSKMPALAMSKDSYTVGREETCDLVLTPYMFDQSSHVNAISKRHFRIDRETTGSGPLFFIYDLSSNGTFINRQKIGKRGKQPLKNNDEISLATMNYRCFMFVVLSSLQDRFPVAVTSKYTISRCLGSGACGEVYEVFGRESSQRYALKAVRKTTFPSSSENGHCNRVQSEVEILKKLNHPCIVKIFDVIETVDEVCMILELVEHGELFDRVKSLGQLCEDDAKFLFLQIVIATKYLHDNGITHRDLKLENILLSGRSNRSLIKITDFGLSKLVDGNTVLRTFCGTRPYMAPEVLLTAGIGTYTSAVDIWSLGVILYACLVGYPPFTEERKDYDLQEQILGGRYDFPDEYWSGISASAKDLVRRLLCVNPTERISLNAALAHPWLSDATIRSQLSDLVETAGYPTLAARVLNHHDHFSPVRNNSDSATVSLDGGSREEDTTKVESKAVTLNLQRRSVNEVLTDGSPAKRTKCVLMEH